MARNWAGHHSWARALGAGGRTAAETAISDSSTRQVWRLPGANRSPGFGWWMLGRSRADYKTTSRRIDDSGRT
jgi:hypothetical protein